jgi:hypothetical protein
VEDRQELDEDKGDMGGDGNGIDDDDKSRAVVDSGKANMDVALWYFW